MKSAHLLLVLAICRSALALGPIPTYSGEVGHLQTDLDPRRQVAIDGITVSRLDDKFLRLNGSDDTHRVWNATIPYEGRVGWTSIWVGDFAGNGRKDFMIAASPPTNGRCPGQVTLTFLMEDLQGMPFPWVLRTELDEKGSFSELPVPVSVGPGGKMELIATRCSYDDGASESRSVSDVYLAEKGRWHRSSDEEARRSIKAAREVGYLKDVLNLDVHGSLFGNDDVDARAAHDVKILSVKRSLRRSAK